MLLEKKNQSYNNYDIKRIECTYFKIFGAISICKPIALFNDCIHGVMSMAKPFRRV